jgi:hypothetical protein
VGQFLTLLGNNFFGFLFIFQYLFVCRRVIDSTVSKTTCKLLGCSTIMIVHTVKLKKEGFMHLLLDIVKLQFVGSFLFMDQSF